MSDNLIEKQELKKEEITYDNYLLLGVPRSGKTTYFCSMANHLQKLATSTGRFGFKYCDNHTSRFINKQMGFLNSGGWPDKTQKKDLDYRFQLDYEKKFMGIKYYTEFVDILYHDYPGEAFNDAFSDTRSGRYENEVEDLHEKIRTAKGIFLMLDVKDIFNNENTELSEETFVSLIKHLKNKKKPPKLALIFNKVELIRNYSHDEYIKKFKQSFGNAYQWLRGMEYEFFSVYTVGGSLRVDENGKIIPPATLHPLSVLRPVNWMIHFI